MYEQTDTDYHLWPGSASFSPGDTPFGIYDSGSQFQADAPKIAKWCAIRLGYPVMNVELTAINFYACLEEAVSEYSSQVNQWNIRNNLEVVKGQSSDTNLTQNLVQGTNLPQLIGLSDSYGTLAGVGGNVDIKRDYIELEPRKQTYDMTEFADEKESGSRIDITRVYYEETPAINRFFDPYSVSGQGTLNLIDEFGFGSFSPAAQFLLMPIYEDLLRIQAIELNDSIRKSSHTFNIVNNKLQIFPIPRKKERLWFEYMVRKDFAQNATNVIGTALDGSDAVSDYSNIRYDFIPYEKINDVGKQWIRKYTLALAKELLGAIREKYSSVPIPNAEISLDGSALRAEGQAEREALVEQLRENLEDLSRKSQFEQKAEEAEHTSDMLRKVPMSIYIG